MKLNNLTALEDRNEMQTTIQYCETIFEVRCFRNVVDPVDSCHCFQIRTYYSCTHEKQ